MCGKTFASESGNSCSSLMGKTRPDSTADAARRAGQTSQRRRECYLPPSERMYRTSAQRSFSGRKFQEGMAPRPVLIFQKISPSDSLWTTADVQSAGFGLSATAAAPSPLPRAPWQDTQLTSATFLPCAIVLASAGRGFFLSLSAAGATHFPWASANAGTPSAAITLSASASPVAPLITWIISKPPRPPGRIVIYHHATRTVKPNDSFTTCRTVCYVPPLWPTITISFT